MSCERVAAGVALLGVALLTSHCGGPSSGGACAPYDADGIVSGSYSFVVTVDDVGFSPAILKAQNRARVLLTVKNTGSKPHGLVIDCLPTPNDRGCPTTSCFPAEARVPTLGPGATGSTTFIVPNPEGIYTIRSELPGDTQTAQFVIQ
jgi:hypothetical protein